MTIHTNLDHEGKKKPKDYKYENRLKGLQQKGERIKRFLEENEPRKGVS